MSTILKALRRLESDRGRPRRSLREEVMGDAVADEVRPKAPAAHRAGAAWLAVGLLLVVGGGLAAVIPLLIHPEPEHVAPTQARRSVPVARPATLPPAASPVRPTRAPTAPPVEPEPPPTRAATAATPGPPPESAAGPPAEAAAAPPRAQRPSPSPSPAREPRPDARADSERVGTATAVAVVERSEAVAAPPEPTPAEPEVARVQLPSLPEVRVESTVWHPRGERRVARIDVVGDGRGPIELREGDAVGGFVVARIEPSAVLFRQGKVEIRRRVGN